MYDPCEWEEAFADIGAELKCLDPKSAIFYASGRACLETSYLYALFARLYGNNNLPDSSNMCHETTSVALKKSFGAPVGTVVLDDFGRPTRSSSSARMPARTVRACCIRCRMPRSAACKIITFNPVRENGLERFVNPQNSVADADRAGKPGSVRQYHQVKTGGDIAAIDGLVQACARGGRRTPGGRRQRVLDRAFIEQQTAASRLSRKVCATRAGRRSRRHRACARRPRGRGRGLCRGRPRDRRIRHGPDPARARRSKTSRMFVNLLLMRGNIGRRAPASRRCAAIPTYRASAPSASPKSRSWCRSTSWRSSRLRAAARQGHEHGRRLRRHLRRAVQGFVGLGGNFVRAIPERAAMEEAWQQATSPCRSPPSSIAAI